MSGAMGISRWALPVAGGVAALVARMMAGGGPPLAATLAVIGGVLVGWTAALMVSSMAHLVGHGGDESAPSGHQLTYLDRDLTVLERRLQDVRLDESMGKLEPQEAAELTEGLMRQVDDLKHASSRQSLDQRIEQQVALRQRGDA